MYTSRDSNDDDQLMEDIRRALLETSTVPMDAILAAQSVFDLRNLDDQLELLTLQFDSYLEPESVTRGDDTIVAARYLSFEARSLSLEIEIRHDAIIGQVVPPQRATVSVVTAAGLSSVVDTDELGIFSLPAPQAAAVRVRCETTSETLQTTWISL